ncbi:MAG TPA: hypothetical protein VEB59_07360 [Gemmatimonadales bacterium]|nr:hypothetical protein [Gemmatimonadales bacterium]
MTVTLTYDTTLSRVRVAAASLDAAAETATVERSTDLVRWTTVRGAVEVAVTGGSMATVDDYEFAADVANHYRITAYDGSAVQTDQETEDITPTLGAVWLKSIGRPFLNLAVSVGGVSSRSRPGRAGIFDVKGRSDPVAVTEVRGSPRWTMTVRTGTAAEARALELLLASGDLLLVHVPATSTVPGGYVIVGDTAEHRFGAVSARRRWDLPLTAVAAPAADVVGSTVTCQAILNHFATCTALLAEFATCADVLEFVADPEDVIVP